MSLGFAPAGSASAHLLPCIPYVEDPDEWKESGRVRVGSPCRRPRMCRPLSPGICLPLYLQASRATEESGPYERSDIGKRSESGYLVPGYCSSFRAFLIRACFVFAAPSSPASRMSGAKSGRYSDFGFILKALQALRMSLCLSALSNDGLIFISRNSLMAKSRCSRASFFSCG